MQSPSHEDKPDDKPAHGVDLTLVGTDEMMRELTRRFDASVIVLHDNERRPADGRPGTSESTLITWTGGAVVARGLTALMARRIGRLSAW